MAHIIADCVGEYSTTEGGGTYSLDGGAVVGNRIFKDAPMATGDTCFYRAKMGEDFEVGLGTFADAATDTLARTTILASSNGGSAVSWGAGAKEIVLVHPATAFSQLNTMGRGGRNIIGRMGGLEVWQRGSSVAVAASSTLYTADGWYLANGANQASTVSRQSGLTDTSTFSARVQRNSGQTGTGTMIFAYPLDTDEIARMRNRKVTLSFSIIGGANFSPASGAVSVNLYCGTGASPAKRGGSSYTGESSAISSTVNVTGSTQRIVLHSAAVVPSNTTQAELRLAFVPSGTAGAADYLQIDDVQIEETPIAASENPRFDVEPLHDVLARCQRHYYRLNAADGTTNTRRILNVLQSFSTTQAWGVSLFLPQDMRSTPTTGMSAVGHFGLGNSSGGVTALSAGSFEEASKRNIGTWSGSRSGPRFSRPTRPAFWRSPIRPDGSKHQRRSENMSSVHDYRWPKAAHRFANIGHTVIEVDDGTGVVRCIPVDPANSDYRALDVEVKAGRITIGEPVGNLDVIGADATNVAMVTKSFDPPCGE
jgi:hypothetical protein